MSIVDEDPHRAPVADPIASALIDAISDATAVLDPHGNIVAVNRAWRVFSGANGGDADGRGVGVSYLDVCLHPSLTPSYSCYT